MKMNLADVEGVIENQIKLGLSQEQIAQTYALAIRSDWPTDWKKVNALIIQRWSKTGLERIEQMAWLGSCFPSSGPTGSEGVMSEQQGLDSGVLTILCGNELVDEAIALDDELKELRALKASVQSGKPVCPHCETAMRPVKHKGYYDAFACWMCECDELPNAEEDKGAYA